MLYLYAYIIWLYTCTHTHVRIIYAAGACAVFSDSLRPHELYNPPGSCVHKISQARILEWVAMPSSGDLPDPGIKFASPISPALQADTW